MKLISFSCFFMFKIYKSECKIMKIEQTSSIINSQKTSSVKQNVNEKLLFEFSPSVQGDVLITTERKNTMFEALRIIAKIMNDEGNVTKVQILKNYWALGDLQSLGGELGILQVSEINQCLELIRNDNEFKNILEKREFNIDFAIDKIRDALLATDEKRVNDLKKIGFTVNHEGAQQAE